MKVNCVEVFDIYCLDRFVWIFVFVCIYIDEGISGVGEVGFVYDLGYSVVVVMIKEMVDVFLIGYDLF